MRATIHDAAASCVCEWSVATRIASLDPEHCAALHTNMPLADAPKEPAPLSDVGNRTSYVTARTMRGDMRMFLDERSDDCQADRS